MPGSALDADPVKAVTCIRCHVAAFRAVCITVITLSGV
jgi:hypothetical protein